jgi:hypothetical protein
VRQWLDSAGAAPLEFPADRRDVAGEIRTRTEVFLERAYALHDGVRRLHACSIWTIGLELKEVAEPTTHGLIIATEASETCIRDCLAGAGGPMTRSYV